MLSAILILLAPTFLCILTFDVYLKILIRFLNSGKYSAIVAATPINANCGACNQERMTRRGGRNGKN